MRRIITSLTSVSCYPWSDFLTLRLWLWPGSRIKAYPEHCRVKLRAFVIRLVEAAMGKEKQLLFRLNSGIIYLKKGVLKHCEFPPPAQRPPFIVQKCR